MNIVELNRLLQGWSAPVKIQPYGDRGAIREAKLHQVSRGAHGRLTVMVSFNETDPDWHFFTQDEIGSSAWNRMFEGKGGIGDMCYSQNEPAYIIHGLNHDTIH